MLNEIITANQLSLVISQAAAPAFLLGAIASFLSVLVSHMSRIADRIHAVDAMTGDARKGAQALWSSLQVRAKLVHRAIYWAVGSGICTCLLMIVAFVTAYLGLRHEPGAVLLFTLSLGLFSASLISFAREVHMALNERNLG
ncbi:MAG TPA: DUF2721 domain-containing protein [Pseudolabrys sp.]|nr:DUF2721 domain-containing protein [Pseudolabrys sp.]